jgi:hypothetical protein
VKSDLTSKVERLNVEALARRSIGSAFGCQPQCARVPFPNGGATHEFDIYAPGLLIGGVSTAPLTVGANSRNTGGCDRACSELLWLSLWPGSEARVHVLTDKALAAWLCKRYKAIPFPHPITIYHYDRATDALAKIGTLHA